MARAGVTYEEIELQAETFVAKGENPTLEKIRRALGDRGSNSTLSKYINEWRGRRAKAIAISHSTINLSDPVNEAVNKVWQQLKEEAEAEISKVREEAREAIELANKSRDQMVLERNQAFQELEIIRGNLNDAKAYNLNLESIQTQIQKELAVTVGRLEEFIHRHEEYKIEKEKQLQELVQNKEQNINYLKEQILSLNQSHQKEINDLRTRIEEQRHQWLVKEDALKVENTRKENILKKMEGVEQQSQQLMAGLKEQLKGRECELENVREDIKLLTERFLISEKTLSAKESLLIESSRWADIHKQERNTLEETLRREREMIGRLEERMKQIEQHNRDRARDKVKEN